MPAEPTIKYHVSCIEDIILTRQQANDTESGAKDLLTDLRHYCDAKDLDFYALIDSSYSHYLAERAEQSEPE